MNEQLIPPRSLVPARDRWDLGKLFVDEAAWEEGLRRFREMLPRIEAFRGTLGNSAMTLRACLDFMMELGLLGERLGCYAQLRAAEDGGEASGQERSARYMQVATEAETLSSWQTPEIQAIPDDRMNSFLAELEDYRIWLEKLLRFKPHVLSEREERLLAMQEEANQTAHKAFSALCDVDLDFGLVKTPEGDRPLSQSSFQSFMLHPERSVRADAMQHFMAAFDGHKNTLASLYAGSLNLDRYRASGISLQAGNPGFFLTRFPELSMTAWWRRLTVTLACCTSTTNCAAGCSAWTGSGSTMYECRW
jgi:oligoendopeptidase F